MLLSLCQAPVNGIMSDIMSGDPEIREKGRLGCDQNFSCARAKGVVHGRCWSFLAGHHSESGLTEKW